LKFGLSPAGNKQKDGKDGKDAKDGDGKREERGPRDLLEALAPKAQRGSPAPVQRAHKADRRGFQRPA
jgi:hypothetical protein